MNDPYVWWVVYWLLMVGAFGLGYYVKSLFHQADFIEMQKTNIELRHHLEAIPTDGVLAIQPMNAAPRPSVPFPSDVYIIGITNWDQLWVIVWDQDTFRWRHGNGANDLAEDGYFRGWLPYHGATFWRVETGPMIPPALPPPGSLMRSEGA